MKYTKLPQNGAIIIVNRKDGEMVLDIANYF